MYKVAVLTSSDKGYNGERKDLSGPGIIKILNQLNYEVVEYIILPDDIEILKRQMLQWCESKKADLILTTGGTGFSDRDYMPEATLQIADRNVPGIAEAIRAHSMQITKRAMLSRAVSVICRNVLIINLPGSPKAIEQVLTYILPQLDHGLDILKGHSKDCI